MKGAYLMCILSLSACASMQKTWQAETCNKDYAYSKGYNDAKNNHEMDLKYSAYCPPPSRAAVREGYQEGYASGEEAIRARQPQTVIIEHRRGRRHRRANSWFCKVKPFTKEYEAFGPTEFEAKRRVMQKCSDENHRMHCEDIECHHDA